MLHTASLRLLKRFELSEINVFKPAESARNKYLVQTVEINSVSLLFGPHRVSAVKQIRIVPSLWFHVVSFWLLVFRMARLLRHKSSVSDAHSSESAMGGGSHR